MTTNNMRVDFFVQNELVPGLNWNSVVNSAPWQMASKFVAEQPALAQIDSFTAWQWTLSFATAVFTLLSARRGLAKAPFALRFLGSWFALAASTILTEVVLLKTTNALSSLAALKGTATFLLAFALLELPPTAYLLRTPLLRFFVYLLHGVSKSAGMIRLGELTPHVFKSNAVFAAFFLFYCKAVATMLCIDFYAKLTNPNARTAAAQGKLNFWLLPAAIFASFVWRPAAIGLDEDTVGLIITDLVVAYYLIAWLQSLFASEDHHVADHHSAPVATQSTTPATMIVEETSSKKLKRA